MRFEYDSKKSEINLAKHGLDFVQAQRIWDLPVLRFSSISSTENRELAIGLYESKFWTAIVVQRGDITRIISVRRSRDEEKELYQKTFNQLS